MTRLGLLGAGSVAFVLAAGACGGGAQPETGGVAPREYFALFSGQWSLDERASDDPRARMSGREGPGGFMAPPGGGRGPGGRGGNPAGMPGGGRGGNVNFEAMRATMEMARSAPELLSLQVDDSTVTVLWPRAGEMTLPVAGDAVVRNRDGLELRFRAHWDGPRLVLERRIVEGGRVVDRMEPVAGGERLLVTRTLEGLRGSPPELRFVYDRRGKGAN